MNFSHLFSVIYQLKDVYKSLMKCIYSIKVDTSIFPITRKNNKSIVNKQILHNNHKPVYYYRRQMKCNKKEV